MRREWTFSSIDQAAILNFAKDGNPRKMKTTKTCSRKTEIAQITIYFLLFFLLFNAISSERNHQKALYLFVSFFKHSLQFGRTRKKPLQHSRWASVRTFLSPCATIYNNSVINSYTNRQQILQYIVLWLSSPIAVNIPRLVFQVSELHKQEIFAMFSTREKLPFQF